MVKGTLNNEGSAKTFLLEYLEGEEAHKVGKAGHVNELDNGPFPGSCFPFYHRQGAHALHGQHIKDHK